MFEVAQRHQEADHLGTVITSYSIHYTKLYEIGYYQGYTLVYNPTTFVILSVLDLLTD